MRNESYLLISIVIAVVYVLILSQISCTDEIDYSKCDRPVQVLGQY